MLLNTRDNCGGSRISVFSNFTQVLKDICVLLIEAAAPYLKLSVECIDLICQVR